MERLCTKSIVKEKRRQGVTHPPKIVISPKEQQSSDINFMTHSHPVLLKINKIRNGSAVKGSLRLYFLQPAGSPLLW